MVDGFEEAKVADLIDPVSRQWDLSLIQGLFDPREADQSGYRFLVKENTTNPAIANLNPHGGMWKLVWSLSIPNNVKNFLRKSC